MKKEVDDKVLQIHERRWEYRITTEERDSAQPLQEHGLGWRLLVTICR
jgi:hypothetical protein